MTSLHSGRPHLLVTGASGFVGSALAARLKAEGARVFGLSRKTPAAAAHTGIEWLTGDLEDADRLTQLSRGMDAVFHAGGMVGHFGSREQYMRVNVAGTRNVINACRTNGIASLVFTSTPSVIADGTDHFGVDETHPYSRRFESPYSESKALAEQEVRAANGRGLRTVCLRPHMVWGPGTGHWVGGLQNLARRRLLYQIGNGTNRVGMTYLEDCIDAHLAAWRAVDADAAVGGQAFFVHGGSPVLLWDWVRDLTRALDLPAVRGRIPKRGAAIAAKACDALVKLSGGALRFPISGYLITELTTDHYSRIDRARSWLKFEPRVSVAEGIARMAAAQGTAAVLEHTPSPAPSLT